MGRAERRHPVGVESLLHLLATGISKFDHDVVRSANINQGKEDVPLVIAIVGIQDVRSHNLPESEHPRHRRRPRHLWISGRVADLTLHPLCGFYHSGLTSRKPEMAHKVGGPRMPEVLVEPFEGRPHMARDPFLKDDAGSIDPQWLLPLLVAVATHNQDVVGVEVSGQLEVLVARSGEHCPLLPLV